MQFLRSGTFIVHVLVSPHLCLPPMQGQCWIEGDNAACSEDSASVYGPVPLALIQVCGLLAATD